MSTAADVRPLSASRHSDARVIRALARLELRRTARNPVLAAGLALSVWMMWTVVPAEQDWPGESYEEMPSTIVPLLFAISLVTAVSFGRERTVIATDAPVGETRRALARLVATLPLIGLTIAFTGLTAWRQRDLGGLWIGQEPGMTRDAHQTTPELLQYVVLAFLAVAVGAAAGRRLPLRGTVPLLFVLWFVVIVTWLFQSSAITPFSVVQVQPVYVWAGPASADPMTFPADWLLSAPGEYQAAWMRQFVSASLAAWHDVWLLGVAALLLAVAWPRSGRRALLVVGTVLAVAGLVGQHVVIP